ncbi:GNAT family N-acetyltransferase [Fibrella forsythiae]|uniref:GNAT family N-acetyltransferase n=1 Tax=Fibrella forsythiae TaxID=2817061 RepID=A0ABS3JQT7_9BACT|nr:GNAT family N-acetyltransferase [Fibrella forsythiae]MBO0952375.1 GNAT family N-acetyltransferase [Fibrella forsythiae]
MITLRPTRSTDLSFVYECLCDLEETVLDREAFERIFLHNIADPAVRYVMAEANNVPVGFLNCHVQQLLHHAGPVGEIQEMYVLPDWRSQGVGQQLVETIVSIARHEGWINLEVTSNRRRERTHAFYERMGFANTHVKLVNWLAG